MQDIVREENKQRRYFTWNKKRMKNYKCSLCCCSAECCMGHYANSKIVKYKFRQVCIQTLSFSLTLFYCVALCSSALKLSWKFVSSYSTGTLQEILGLFLGVQTVMPLVSAIKFTIWAHYAALYDIPVCFTLFPFKFSFYFQYISSHCSNMLHFVKIV